MGGRRKWSRVGKCDTVWLSKLFRRKRQNKTIQSFQFQRFTDPNPTLCLFPLTNPLPPPFSPWKEFWLLHSALKRLFINELRSFILRRGTNHCRQPPFGCFEGIRSIKTCFEPEKVEPTRPQWDSVFITIKNDSQFRLNYWLPHITHKLEVGRSAHLHILTAFAGKNFFASLGLRLTVERNW